MPDTIRIVILGAFALFAAIANSPALAQQDRWFKVELLIFANDPTAQPDGAAMAEQWEATPALAYPLAARFLIDPVRVAENEAEFDGESLVDEYGRQIITILTAGDLTDDAPTVDVGINALPQPEEPVDVPDTAPSTAVPVPVPPTPVYQGGAPPDSIATGLEPAAPKPLALPRPFVLLPGDYREFRGKAALMQRSGRYTVLFHETWVQPVPPEEDSLPIVIDHSGDEQAWPQLQGSINLYLSRYLHVQTNLWLNTAGEYLPGTWQMPAPPLGPPSLIIEEQQPIDIAAEIGKLPEPALPGTGDDAPGIAGGAEIATGPDVAVKIDPLTGPPAEGSTLPDPNDPLAGPQDEEESVEVEPPVYPYRHAVLLEQTRRMRSNEIHYIDHPLLGVIIKFTPMTAEDLDAIAAQQQPVAEGSSQLP